MSMNWKLPEFLRTMFDRFGTAEAPLQEPEASDLISVSRQDLTFDNDESTYKRRKTSASLGALWDEIGDLLHRGFVYGEIQDRQTEYVEAVRQVAEIIHQSTDFDIRIEIPQETIDTLVHHRGEAIWAKEMLLARDDHEAIDEQDIAARQHLLDRYSEYMYVLEGYATRQPDQPESRPWLQ